MEGTQKGPWVPAPDPPRRPGRRRRASDGQPDSPPDDLSVQRRDPANSSLVGPDSPGCPGLVPGSRTDVFPAQTTRVPEIPVVPTRRLSADFRRRLPPRRGLRVLRPGHPGFPGLTPAELRKRPTTRSGQPRDARDFAEVRVTASRTPAHHPRRTRGPCADRKTAMSKNPVSPEERAEINARRAKRRAARRAEKARRSAAIEDAWLRHMGVRTPADEAAQREAEQATVEWPADLPRPGEGRRHPSPRVLARWLGVPARNFAPDEVTGMVSAWAVAAQAAGLQVRVSIEPGTLPSRSAVRPERPWRRATGREA